MHRQFKCQLSLLKKKKPKKLNIQKTKIMAICPITSRQIDGKTMETVRDFILGGLQDHCRWWPQPWNWKMLAPWKKNYDQPRQHIKKQRRTKVRLVKAMVFPVVIYACENWTIKKSESEVTQSCPTLCNPMTMGFSRQEYWSELPFPSPENLPNTGIL